MKIASIMKINEKIKMWRQVSDACHKIFHKYNKDNDLEVADILQCLATNVKMFIASQVETKEAFYEAYGYYSIELGKNINEFIKTLKHNDE